MFILDRPNSKEPTYIFIKTTLPDGELKYSTRIKILPIHWLQAARRAIINNVPKDMAKQNGAVNALLSRIEKEARNYTQSLMHGDEPDRERLVGSLDVITGRRSAFKRKTFFDTCREIADGMASGSITIISGPNQGKRYSEGTVKNYRLKLETIREFHSIKPFGFESITINTYYSFIEFCNKKEYSLNYTGLLIKVFKGFLQIAYQKGIHKNKIYKDFKVLSEETDDVAVSDEEIALMMKLKLTGKLELARDWFCLGCYLGLRVVDIKLLDKKHIEKDRVMIVNEKTDRKVVLPIHPVVETILKKYKGLPPKMYEQKINEYIKKVAKLAGIKEKFIYSVTEGGIRHDYYFQKWEMISNHTMRRALVTNLRRAGMNDAQRMQLAGIESYNTLKRYDKTTPEQNADDTAKHPFFSKKMKVV